MDDGDSDFSFSRERRLATTLGYVALAIVGGLAP